MPNTFMCILWDLLFHEWNVDNLKVHGVVKDRQAEDSCIYIRPDHPAVPYLIFMKELDAEYVENNKSKWGGFVLVHTNVFYNACDDIVTFLK